MEARLVERVAFRSEIEALPGRELAGTYSTIAACGEMLSSENGSKSRPSYTYALERTPKSRVPFTRGLVRFHVPAYSAKFSVN